MNRTLFRRDRLPEAAGVVFLAAWPFLFPTSYDLRVFTLAGIYALLVLGYQFIFGQAGALALTQGTFFGVSAYVTGMLSTKYQWGFLATFPLSVLAPVILAVIVAAPVLRLASHYFALATLGIAQVVLLLCLHWDAAGGANGIPGVPGIVVLGTPVARGWPVLLLVWGFAGLGALVAWQILRGAYGRAFHVMRESETAALSIGLDVGGLRFVAFLLSAAYAGVAGALFIHTIRVISPEVLELPVMVACLAMTVIGGRTRIAGAFIGAFLLVHLPEWFRFLDKYYLVAYGVVLLAVIVVAPDGLVGFIDRWRRGRTEAPPAPRSLRPRAGAIKAAGRFLRIESVSKSFGGVRALDNVTLDIARGEIFGLIGPNGSGKTTLINTMTGLYTADAGTIALAGTTLTGLRPFEISRRGVARTFQNLNLVDDLSALDNVAIARAAAEGLTLRSAIVASLHDLNFERTRGEAMHLLEQLGVTEAMRLCGDLPYGVKRRVEIARALALQPELLLLDEPAAGLNETEQGDLANRLRGLAEGGCTLMVIEHNMPFLMPLVGRLVCLDQGKVIAAGTPAEIRADPRVIEAYLGHTDKKAAS